MDEQKVIEEVERIVRGEDLVKVDQRALFQRLGEEIAASAGAAGVIDMDCQDLSNPEMDAFFAVARGIPGPPCRVHGGQQCLMLIGFPTKDGSELVVQPMWGCPEKVADEFVRVMLIAALTEQHWAGDTGNGCRSGARYAPREGR